MHQHGGRVYVDGANMNALVGLAAPGEFGGDVSHLNLHKTFCIPHGGGGPGVGPVCVVEDLVPFLPAATRRRQRDAAVGRRVGRAARQRRPCCRSRWMYMPHDGRRGPAPPPPRCAILSANYVAARLADHCDIHYSGDVAGIKGGGVAHECILDLRPLKDSQRRHRRRRGQAADRLRLPRADAELPGGRHADGRADRERAAGRARPLLRRDDRDPRGDPPRSKTATGRSDDNPLKHAPHTAAALLAADWNHALHARAGGLSADRRSSSHKYWSPVGRVDNVYGDRNLFCSCVPMSAFAEDLTLPPPAHARPLATQDMSATAEHAGSSAPASAGSARCIHRRRLGDDNFLLVEQAGGVGGTWWANRYPGAACDIPSHLYSFSFAPHASWTRKYPGAARDRDSTSTIACSASA